MISLLNIILVATYCKLWVYDTIEYWYVYLILSLPAFMFGAPLIKVNELIRSSDSSDSDSDSDNNHEVNTYEVFISQLVFIFKTNEINPVTTTRTLNGLQLKPLIDVNGRFFIGNIHKYFPNLDTILLSYIKYPMDVEYKFHESKKEIMVIDVVKRYDIRNQKSYKMGVTF
jgi:hypothetical protein